MGSVFSIVVRGGPVLGAAGCRRRSERVVDCAEPASAGQAAARCGSVAIPRACLGDGDRVCPPRVLPHWVLNPVVIIFVAGSGFVAWCYSLLGTNLSPYAEVVPGPSGRRTGSLPVRPASGLRRSGCRPRR